MSDEVDVAGGTGRVVLVTGANRGLGTELAARFARAGHRVAATYRAEHPHLGEAEDSGRVLWVPLDVRQPDQVDAAFTAVEERWGPVEVLVSNAGANRDGLVLRMSDDDFTSVVDANLSGGFRLAKRALQRMVRARWGRIVFVSSVVARSGQVGQANYAASKAGLIGLARSLAREVASRGITVNVVAPGPIPTDMTGGMTDAARAAVELAVPLGRFGTLAEVAAAVEFLASEEAGYITGAVVPVDGGLGMGG